jgi:hypothetical protein
MSGDMNTSSGNITLMCALLYAFLTEIGIKPSVINNGDDAVIFCEQEELPLVVDNLDRWFLEMGKTMTSEPPAKVIEEIEFCQGRPVWTPNGYVMVRGLARAMAKDVVSFKVPMQSDKMFRKRCKAIGDCGMALAGRIPIFQSFYSAFQRGGEGAVLSSEEEGRFVMGGLYWQSRGMKRSSGDIHPTTRVSFYRAFGVTPDLQEYCEEHLDNVHPRYSSPAFLMCPELRGYIGLPRPFRFTEE